MSKKTLRERLSDKVLYDLLKLAVVFLFSSSGAIAFARALSTRFSALSEYRWPIGLFTGAVLAASSYWVVSRLDRAKPWYRRIRTDFEIVRKDIEYTYLTRTHLRYMKRITLKARRHGLERYVDKYNWSGRGTIHVSSMIPEHIIEDQGSRNIWRLYSVNFGRSLRKGELIEIAIVWDLEDAAHKSIPFFSQSVNEPTESLSFLLRLPVEFGVRRMTCTILPTIEFLTPFASFAQDMKVRSDFCEGEWEVKKPRLLHCYQITWTDPESMPSGIRSIEETSEGQHVGKVVVGDNHDS